MISVEADSVLFDSLKNRYQKNLMKGSEFVFDHVHLLHYCHKINPNRG